MSLEEVMKVINVGRAVDVVYMDFCGAIDRVPHDSNKISRAKDS